MVLRCRLKISSLGCLAFGVGCFALAPDLGAQVPVVYYGRVEDAVSRTPVAGARIVAPDSTAVFSDSIGNFRIQGRLGEPISLEVQQYGYTLQRFDLDQGATSRISVLLLEPAAIELEGVSIVAESAIEEQRRVLGNRRNAYAGSVAALDKEQLDRLFPVASAWDVVRSRAPRIFECRSSRRSGLCIPGRSRSFRNPFPEVPVQVCVDSWESYDSVGELQSLDVRQVALIEVYSGGRDGIRVYTARYLASSASTGRNIALPLQFGC